MRAATTMLLCAAALGACDLTTSAGGITAPVLPEPLAGTTLDRCLIRARMSQPWDTHGSTVVTGNGDVMGIHADYRINHGPQIPVDNYTFVQAEESNYRLFAPLIFGATLVPGANHLEVGSCDSIDTCQWTPTDVTVKLGPGSPDPAFAGSGQVVISSYPEGFHALPMPDGSTIVSVATSVMNVTQVGLVRIRKDGTLDTSYGARGFALLTNNDAAPWLAPLPSGGVLVALSGTRLSNGKTWIARVGSDGKLDAKLGTAGLIELALPGVGAYIDVRAFAPDGSGNVALVAIVADAGHGGGAAPLVAQISPDGKVLASHLLAAGDPAFGIRTASLDTQGNAAVLAADRAWKGNATVGPDPRFGTGGTMMLARPTLSATIAIAPTSGDVVLVEQTGANNLSSTLTVVTIPGAGGAMSSFDLPFVAPIFSTQLLAAVAADGSLYVAGGVVHPANTKLSFTDNNQDGHDFGLIRIKNGAQDMGFGKAGFATASMMLSFTPPAIDSLDDLPTELFIGSDGAPWILGSSASPSMVPTINDTRRGPGTGIVRFMK